jgi:hypothetical protein
VRHAQTLGLLVALLGCGAGCSSESEKQQVDLLGATPDASLMTADAGAGGSNTANGSSASGSVDSGAAVVIEVPANSAICGKALPFKPPGCACNTGETAACWTGPADSRLKGKCRDGVQKCLPTQEFGIWGPCEGEVVDCGEPPPPTEDCSCVPGKIVGCDEDCTAFVFCAPFSTKVCQPDGKFGPCRESILPTGEDTNLCLNVFNGCFPENAGGTYIGDCGKVFVCGHPPSGPAPIN